MAEHSTERTYDMIIIGGGPGGLAAALYAQRYGMDVLLIAKEMGGLLTTTHIVENYPGILPMSGPDMMDVFVEQVKMFETPLLEAAVTELERLEDGEFHVCTDSVCYRAKTVVFATGTQHKHLHAPGEEEYRNKGVSYCATCDGFFFKNRVITIVGGGDSAAKEALLLSDYGSKVYMLCRSTLKGEPINNKRVRANPKITVIEGVVIEEVHGDGQKLTHVMLSKEFEGSRELRTDGLFVAIGHIAQTELARPLGVKMNARGEIEIDRTSRTSMPGFYAAGDCTDTGWKQAIISAAEGSQAANSAYEDLTNNVVLTK